MYYTPDKIRERLRATPFRPFRIIASEGLRFEVYHPELVMVGERDISIGSPSAKYPEGVYDRMTRVALIHIVGMEDLPVPASPGNGQT